MQFERWLRNRQLVRSALLLLALAVATLIQYWGDKRSDGHLEGTPKLVDGDSFFLAGKEVRMQGIDAPEWRQSCTRDGKSWPCGEEARRQLARLLAGQKMVCRIHSVDQHGRLLAHCSAGGQDLNAAMVSSGFAVAFGDYEAQERSAREARRGLWSGEFQRPRDWRRDNNPGR